MIATTETLPDYPDYEVLAIRYAEAVRPAGDLVLRPSPGEPDGRIDYFVWLVRGGGRTLLIDTGFGARAAAARRRTLLRCPGDGLRALGVEPADVTDVVITHLHYDHAGNTDLFPNARFYLQLQEMAGATGPDMLFAPCRIAFDAQDVTAMVGHVFADRVHFVDGDHDLAPGISLHVLSGHTRGLQGVRVHTGRGWVMLGSDVLHFYRNMTEENPFPGFVDLPEALAAARKALALADSGDHLIPGHDPLVLQLFPPHPDVPDVAVLSLPPVSPTPLRAMRG
jgi:glyoxylase-like metal-dependent hydrolase (beta-lactamase superfamily II)